MKAVANEKSNMSVLGHFNELRKRLLVMVVALLVTTSASFAISQTLAEWLALPIGGLAAMSAIEVTENVSAFMRISLLSGLVLAMPVPAWCWRCRSLFTRCWHSLCRD